MKDQAEIIIQAQQRALALLSEHHEPLSMAPGEVRQLLGRYQRGLSELTRAIGPPASSDHSISASDATSLRELRAQWEDVYVISFRDGTWSASPFRRRTRIITAGSAFGLREALRHDYAAAIPARERGHMVDVIVDEQSDEHVRVEQDGH